MASKIIDEFEEVIPDLDKLMKGIKLVCDDKEQTVLYVLCASRFIGYALGAMGLPVTRDNIRDIVDYIADH